MLSAASRLTWRAPSARWVCPLAALAGLLAAPAPTLPLMTGLVGVADRTTLMQLLLAPWWATVVFGLEADAAVFTDRHLARVGGHAWARAQLAAALLALGASSLAFVLAGTARVVTAHGPVLEAVGYEQLGRSVAFAAITLLAYGLWAGGLFYLRSTRTCMLAGAGVVSMHLAGLYAPSEGPLAVLRALWPTTALRVIAAGSDGHPLGVGVLAVLVVTGTTGAALWRLQRRPAVSDCAPPRGRPSSVKWRRTGLAVVAGCLVTGAVVPAGLAQQLPWQLRPSLALARLSGQAPDQQVTEFLNELWRGDLEAAGRRTTSSNALETLGAVGRLLRVRPGAFTVYLSDMAGPTRARVTYDASSLTVSLCMDRSHGRWLVRSADPMGRCS